MEKLTIWGVAILLVTLLTYGCGDIFPPGSAGYQLMVSQIENLEKNIKQAEADIAAGNGNMEEAALNALKAQLADLKAERDKMEAALAQLGEKTIGLPPEIALPAGGGATALIFMIIQSLLGLRRQGQKLSSAKKDLWDAVNNGNGAKSKTGNK